MITGRDQFDAVAWGNNIYALGGTDDIIRFSSIERASINSDGSAGSWSNIGNLPSPRANHQAVAYGGYLYVIGGVDNNAQVLGTVHYATINSDGSLGSWQTAPALNTPRYNFAAVAANGNLYVLGGTNSSTLLASVEYARIGTNGTLGKWQTTTGLNTARSAFDAVARHGYIYVVAGIDGPTTKTGSVEYAPIHTDGTLGTWSNTSSLLTPRAYTGAYADADAVYVLGGADSFNNSIASVEKAAINGDHSLGTWQASNSLTQDKFAIAVAAANNNLYVLGGHRLGVYLTTVERSSLPGNRISGRVTNGAGSPVSGVLVSASSGENALTDASGYYTITGLITGTYTLTPAKGGSTFSPMARTINVPPDAVGQDFTWRRGQPILLVHGWMGLRTNEEEKCGVGFGRWGETDTVTNTYFGKMTEWLYSAGYDVWIAHLDSAPDWPPRIISTPPIEVNAECLKNQITQVQQTTQSKVTLIAHSMGGLVSRACLSQFDDCRNNVKALYTLGTPHSGINGLPLLLRLLFPSNYKDICIFDPAVCQFGSDYMSWFNLSHPNQDGLKYSFIGGTKTGGIAGQFLTTTDGSNDGFVGNRSARGRALVTVFGILVEVNAILGQMADGYSVAETHDNLLVGTPSYFDVHNGEESQAFRCLTQLIQGMTSPADCPRVSDMNMNTSISSAQAQPATTIDLTGTVLPNQVVSETLEVDTDGQSTFYLSWITGTLSLTITRPNGEVIDPTYATLHPDVVAYTSGISGVTPSFATYAFTNTLPGVYTLTVGMTGDNFPGASYQAFASMETSRSFTVTTNADLYQVGQTAAFTGSLASVGGGINGATVLANLTFANGISVIVPLVAQGNGTYSGAYVMPDIPGYLQATFTAVGTDGGIPFTRQTNQLLVIAPHSVQLAGTYSGHRNDTNSDGFADTLSVDVGITVTQVGTYTVSANLFANSQFIAHASDYRLLAAGRQTVTLQLDGWDIRQSHMDGPYNVTDLYVIDQNIGGLPSVAASNAWSTAAYHWQDFGFESIYLPLILRSY